MKRVHALYASNMDDTNVLLLLDPETDNQTAIEAIAQKMQEVETCDIDEEEYYQETGTTPEDFREFAEAIWSHNETIYLENRFEVTYGLTLNVPLI
jgi:hypothetical protein